MIFQVVRSAESLYFPAALVFSFKAVCQLNSGCYLTRGNKLAGKLAAQMEERHKSLDKLSLIKKEYEGLDIAN